MMLRTTESKNSGKSESSESLTHKILKAWNLRFLEPEIPKAQNSNRTLEFKNPGTLEERTEGSKVETELPLNPPPCSLWG